MLLCSAFFPTLVISLRHTFKLVAQLSWRCKNPVDMLSQTESSRASTCTEKGSWPWGSDQGLETGAEGNWAATMKDSKTLLAIKAVNNEKSSLALGAELQSTISVSKGQEWIATLRHVLNTWYILRINIKCTKSSGYWPTAVKRKFLKKREVILCNATKNTAIKMKKKKKPD